MDMTINTNAAQVKLSGVKTTEMTEKTESKAVSENAPGETVPQVRKFDTVELSSEAEEYLAEDAATDDGSVNILGEYAAESSDDSSDDLNELYTYTDDELADLLRDGEITRTEYNNEMAKRTSSAE
ncbi:MAG: hypothetical protein ACI4XA_00930 [Oscillospiraceae bacterium]